MSCDDVTKRLAEGAPLDAAEQQHAAGCPSCQSLLAPVQAIEALDEEHLSAIRERVVAASAPVKPLPSDRVLIAFLTAVFLAFILLVARIVKMRALGALTPVQMLAYFGLILACALAGAAVIVGEMIPGSRLRSGSRMWMAATAVILPLTCVAIFRSYSTVHFVSLGIPCFEMGSACALGASLLLSLFLRKGFVAFRRSAARVAGFLAALAGVAVLALHCPFLSVAHIVTWHFGVLLAGWLAGDLIGRRLEPR